MMSESEVPKKRFTADRTRLFPSEWKFRRFSRSYEPFDSRSPITMSARPSSTGCKTRINASAGYVSSPSTMT